MFGSCNRSGDKSIQQKLVFPYNSTLHTYTFKKIDENSVYIWQPVSGQFDFWYGFVLLCRL